MNTSARRTFIQKTLYLTMIVFIMITMIAAPSAEVALANGSPHFAVIMNNELVHGYNWPLGAVTMEIDDPSNGVGIDYSDTQPSIEAPWDPLTNWVEFDLSGSFVVEPGHIVTLTDGVTPKSHIVTDLIVVSVDPDTDDVVAKKWAARDERVKYIFHPEREPYGASWLRAWEAAKGEFVCNSNTDDFHHPDFTGVFHEVMSADRF